MCVNARGVTEKIKVPGVEVVKVNEFKYIGSAIQSNGQWTKEEETGAGRLEWMVPRVI